MTMILKTFGWFIFRRPRIDRSMIGNPTDFRHTAHIGSADFLSMSTTTTNVLQRQMCSKGDYDSPTINVPHIINARSLDEIRRKWNAVVRNINSVLFVKVTTRPVGIKTNLKMWQRPLVVHSLVTIWHFEEWTFEIVLSKAIFFELCIFPEWIMSCSKFTIAVGVNLFSERLFAKSPILFKSLLGFDNEAESSDLFHARHVSVLRLQRF